MRAAWRSSSVVLTRSAAWQTQVIDYAKKYEHPKLNVMFEAEEERRAAKRAAS